MARPGRSVEEAQDLARAMIREYLAARRAITDDARVKKSDLRQVLRYRGLGAFLDLVVADLVREKVIALAPEGNSVYVLPREEREGGGA